jgi:uncharacterized protein
MASVDLFQDAAAFSAAVGPWLEEHEAENGLFLGILATLVREPPAAPPLMVVVVEGDRILFAALEGHINLIISRGPDPAIDAAVTRLRLAKTKVTGVVGPAREAERFALGWVKERGSRAVLAVDQRIYELTTISWPAPVPGQMRPIAPGDLALVADWAQAFDAEALPPEEARTLEEARATMATRTRDGNLFGWEVAGQLVSLAGLSRPTATSISVNSVYTPPAHRRRGFATALVAAVSQQGLARGKTRCLLYTDLANPTSNAIYQKIGYRPVCDSRNYRIRPL